MIAHATHAGLPMSADVAGVVLAVGFVAVLVAAYDYYRHQWSGGE